MTLHGPFNRSRATAVDRGISSGLPPTSIVIIADAKGLHSPRVVVLIHSTYLKSNTTGQTTKDSRRFRPLTTFRYNIIEVIFRYPANLLRYPWDGGKEHYRTVSVFRGATFIVRLMTSDTSSGRIVRARRRVQFIRLKSLKIRTVTSISFRSTLRRRLTPTIQT